MKYDIEKLKNIEIMRIGYETFDYYSNNPKPFDELKNFDKRLLKKIQEIHNNKLFVLASMNKILSISKNHRYFDQAMAWAKLYIGG